MHNPTHVRGTLRGVAVLGLLLSITALWSSPAFGHADEGEMKITKATATSPTTIEVEAGITFANDDDLAEEAVVTATVTDQAGTSVGPIPMPRRTHHRATQPRDLDDRRVVDRTHSERHDASRHDDRCVHEPGVDDPDDERHLDHRRNSSRELDNHTRANG